MRERERERDGEGYYFCNGKREEGNLKYRSMTKEKKEIQVKMIGVQNVELKYCLLFLYLIEWRSHAPSGRAHWTYEIEKYEWVSMERK